MPPKSRSGSLSLVGSPDGGWILVRPASTPKRRKSRESGAVNTEEDFSLPVFLQTQEFGVLDKVEIRGNLLRRTEGVLSTSEVRLKVELRDGTPTFIVARQQSGSISFHFPQVSPIRSVRGKVSQGIATFDITAFRPNPAGGRRGSVSDSIKVILIKLTGQSLDKLSEHAATWAVPRLAKALEVLLWNKKNLGWVSVTRSEMEAVSDHMANARPFFPSPGRGLLLIHGTFSSAHTAFRNLTKTQFFTFAEKEYGENIFAFNHFTVSKTPAENATDLLDSLPDQDFEFDVVTHSRGGLVIQEILRGVGLRHPNRARLRIRNVVMVASPNVGTPLASPSRWDKKLSFLTNLLEILPASENPFAMAASWIAESLKWAALNILGNCVGLAAMDPESEYLGELQNPPPRLSGTCCYALVSNFCPPGGWLARIADMRVDSFFGEANDLVVPTSGGWKNPSGPAAWISGQRVACFGVGGNIGSDSDALHHGAFFGNSEAISYIISCLRGVKSCLPPLDTTRALVSRKPQTFGVEPGESALPATRRLVSKLNNHEKRDDSYTAWTAGTAGWCEEEGFLLTVVSNNLFNKIEDEEISKAVPLLVAQYGSARVATPFYTSGTADNAGKRWHSIIRMHRQIVNYSNGGSFSDGNTAEGENDFPSEKFLEKFGEELFRTLFPGEVRNLYNVARFLHKKRRLRIVFSSMIPWVADVPWELAYDPSAGSFLACGDVRFVRNVLTSTPANKIQEKDGILRILVVSAQPLGSGHLSIEDERRGIYESFRPLIDAGLVDVEVLVGASPSLLHERLRYQPEGRDFDVLHFIGHGEFDEMTKAGYLLFEDEVGRPKRLSASNFLNILRGRDIRVVFLNACETGRGKQADYNKGVAMTLVQDGIPAVVANQYSVIDRSASLFSLHFYACLANGISIADAMREARIALQYCGVEPMDWAVPVLFANNPDARLCRMPATYCRSEDGFEDSFSILSKSTRTLRTLTGSRRKTVAVWDAENALVYRENLTDTLEELNAAQDSFVFQLERFTAPRSLWAVESNPSSDGVAYLRADRVMRRMERIRQSIGADYFFCVTELPLRDEETSALYFLDDGQICILSTWALDPPLEGRKLKKALANHLAILLLSGFCDGVACGTHDHDPLHPIHTVGFWNNSRNVSHIAGQMHITEATLLKIRAHIGNVESRRRQFEAILVLLGLYK